MKSGIDLRHVERSIRVQDDLFRHVNGRWLDEAEIPEDKARYGEFIRLHEQAEKQVHAIIEHVAASSPAPGTDEQLENSLGIRKGMFGVVNEPRGTARRSSRLSSGSAAG